MVDYPGFFKIKPNGITDIGLPTLAGLIVQPAQEETEAGLELNQDTARSYGILSDRIVFPIQSGFIFQELPKAAGEPETIFHQPGSRIGRMGRRNGIGIQW